MKVLVLGGSYFVGRHIALEFCAQGHQVTLLNRGTRAISLPTMLADRDDAAAVQRSLAGHSFDVVVDTSCRDAKQALTAARALENRYGRYVMVSAPAVYDDDAPRPLRESSLADGALSWTEYGINKAHAEAALRRFCGPRLTIVRPGYVYGPYNSFARETFVWSRVLRNRPVFVPGNGATRLSFVYAPDLARLVVSLAQHDKASGRTLNVAHAEPLTFDAWVHEVASAAQVRARIVHVPHGTLGLPARDFFPFRDRDTTLDVSTLHADMELSAPTPMAEGLAQTFTAYSRPALESMARESSVDLELSLILGAG
jgi:nucleoside-diphosphate-sugar epimerase